jgi:hypothetical protein
MKIKSIQDLKNIPEGIVYESKPKTMRYYWTLLFGLLT